MSWWVENNSVAVRFRGDVRSRDDLEQAIAAMTAQLPLLDPDTPTPNRSGEADKTGTGLAEGKG